MTIDAPAAHQIPALRALWKQAFGDPDPFLDSFFHTAFSPARCRCIVMDGALAAALYWFDCTWENKPLAYVYAVATDTAFRGQGLCRALMADTHTHLQKLGYQGSILVPCGPELFAMYKKLGYRTCCTVTEWDCLAGETPARLRQISAGEYATLRRQMLPEGSVVQEREALALLDAQGAFYAGENCLLVCAPEGGKLMVSELLGSPEAAPGILAALGCAQGRFRMPGTENPFAMYRSLTGDPRAPGYFGLALD